MGDDVFSTLNGAWKGNVPRGEVEHVVLRMTKGSCPNFGQGMAKRLCEVLLPNKKTVKESDFDNLMTDVGIYKSIINNIAWDFRFRDGDGNGTVSYAVALEIVSNYNIGMMEWKSFVAQRDAQKGAALDDILWFVLESRLTSKKMKPMTTTEFLSEFTRLRKLQIEYEARVAMARSRPQAQTNIDEIKESLRLPKFAIQRGRRETDLRQAAREFPESTIRSKFCPMLGLLLNRVKKSKKSPYLKDKLDCIRKGDVPRSAHYSLPEQVAAIDYEESALAFVRQKTSLLARFCKPNSAVPKQQRQTTLLDRSALFAPDIPKKTITSANGAALDELEQLIGLRIARQLIKLNHDDPNGCTAVANKSDPEVRKLLSDLKMLNIAFEDEVTCIVALLSWQSSPVANDVQRLQRYNDAVRYVKSPDHVKIFGTPTKAQSASSADIAAEINRQTDLFQLRLDMAEKQANPDQRLIQYLNSALHALTSGVGLQTFDPLPDHVLVKSWELSLLTSTFRKNQMNPTHGRQTADKQKASVILQRRKDRQKLLGAELDGLNINMIDILDDSARVAEYQQEREHLGFLVDHVEYMNNIQAGDQTGEHSSTSSDTSLRSSSFRRSQKSKSATWRESSINEPEENKIKAEKFVTQATNMKKSLKEQQAEQQAVLRARLAKKQQTQVEKDEAERHAKALIQQQEELRASVIEESAAQKQAIQTRIQAAKGHKTLQSAINLVGNDHDDDFDGDDDDDDDDDELDPEEASALLERAYREGLKSGRRASAIE